jgi:hypothetical protein
MNYLEKRFYVETKEYADWLYNFIKKGQVYDDETAMYKMQEGEDKEKLLLISHFQRYIEELAEKYEVENITDPKNNFEVLNFEFQIRDRFFNITTMVGQGAITFVNEIDEPTKKYIKI